MTIARDPSVAATSEFDDLLELAEVAAATDPDFADAYGSGDLDTILEYMEAHGGHFYGSRKTLAGGGAVPGGAADPGSAKPLGGSTGARMVTVGGKPFVEKEGASVEHVREEATANRIYEIAGVPVPPSRLIEQPDGTVTQRAAFVTGTPLNHFVMTASPDEVAAVRSQIQKGLATDALLANWDSVGLVGDNIIVTPKGVPYRVDNGGSLRFRAQGGLKGDRFGTHVGELTTLTDPSKGSWATDMFSGMSKGEVRSQVEALAAKRPQILAALPKELRPTVSARLDDMLDQTNPLREADGYDLFADAFYSADVDRMVAVASEIMEAHGGHFYGARGGLDKGGGGGYDDMARREAVATWQGSFGNCRLIQNEPDSDVGRAFADALDKSPTVAGPVFRGVTEHAGGAELPASEARAVWEARVGSEMTVKHPVSSSTSDEVARRYGDVVLELHGARARDIRKWSAYPDYPEAVIPGGRFRVTSVADGPPMTQTVFGPISPRPTILVRLEAA